MGQSVSVTKDNKKCEVFFYERWAGYSHPVKMIGPLDFTEALLRGNYQRAWMCGSEPRSLFTLLEGISVEGLQGASLKPDDLLAFFSVREENGGEPVKGEEVSLQDAFALEIFFIVLKGPDGKVSSTLIRQKKYSQFEYFYDASGKMTRLRVTDMFGDSKELDY